MAVTTRSKSKPKQVEEPAQPAKAAAKNPKKRSREQEHSAAPEVDASKAKKPKKTAQPAKSKGSDKKKKGKAAAGLPVDIQRIVPESKSRYPSPYAVIPKEDFDFEKIDSSPAVKIAYRVQRNGRNRVQQAPDFVWKDDAAYAVWYRHGDWKAPAVAEPIYTRPLCMEAWIEGHGQVSWDDLVSNGVATKQGIAHAPQAGSCRAMEVYREGNGREAKFFLSWHNVQTQVTMNGTKCAPSVGGVFVGPLPNFAIIEVEETVIFWFRNREALGYVSQDIIARRTAAGSDGVKDAAAVPVGKVNGQNEKKTNEAEKKGWRKRWWDMWAVNIKRHEKEAKGDDSWPWPTKIDSDPVENNLWGDEVVQAIGSLWCALDEKTDRRFAFHDYFSYQLVRGAMTDVKTGYRDEMTAAVNGPGDLLIPMHFTMDPEDMSPPNSANEEKFRMPEHTTPEPPVKRPAKEKKKTHGTEGQAKEKKPIGHIIFALAQLRPGNKANVNVMDSRPGCIDHDRIIRRVSRTIRKIGWLKMDKRGHAVEPEREPELVVDNIVVPQQEGVDSCGIYSIFNAWMSMLGLPMVNQHSRIYYPERGLPGEDVYGPRGFIECALRMIDCALAGHMELQTVQAFLNYFGYCELQNPYDKTIVLERHSTVRTNSERLQEILSSKRAEQQKNGAPVERRRYSVEDIRYVKEKTQCAHSEVLELLRICGGRRDAAAVAYEYMKECTDYDNKEILRVLAIFQGDAVQAVRAHKANSSSPD
ncbi:MAG: hypothetical protein Q9208_003317 [Pyrenodesmia sp. 3 TL-2023]